MQEHTFLYWIDLWASSIGFATKGPTARPTWRGFWREGLSESHWSLLCQQRSRFRNGFILRWLLLPNLGSLLLFLKMRLHLYRWDEKEPIGSKYSHTFLWTKILEVLWPRNAWHFSPSEFTLILRLIFSIDRQHQPVYFIFYCFEDLTEQLFWYSANTSSTVKNTLSFEKWSFLDKAKNET